MDGVYYSMTDFILDLTPSMDLIVTPMDLILKLAHRLWSGVTK